MAIQFQEINAFLSHIKISVYSMSYAGNATIPEKLQKIKNSEHSGNFSIGKCADITCSRVAVFFTRWQAIISENCIAIGRSENKRMT